jgi:hypothetical protein
LTRLELLLLDGGAKRSAAPLSQLLRAANSQLSAQSLSIEVRNWTNYLATLIPIEAVEADTALLVFLVPKSNRQQAGRVSKNAK